MLERNAAEGIHRVEDAHTNWYLVEDGDGVTIVDTGLPRSWQSLLSALSELGRTARDLEAVVLTHGHFDHMGFARRAQQTFGIPLFAHPDELSLIRHPWRYDHERSRVPYLLNPAFLKVLTEMTAMGALWVKGSETARTYRDDERLDVPGKPRVIFTPGHTHGHCSLLFEDRGAVIVGDALVMLDPYTGRDGPCLVARSATADSAKAMASLDKLGQLQADVMLTGHGPVWRGGMGVASERARAAGTA
jgi:glyoxylase-like metal-dependent hydrolase (beta-lactamase superfamily II)